MRHIARSRTSKSTSWLCSHFEMWVVVGVGGLYAGNPISRMSFVRREEGVFGGFWWGLWNFRGRRFFSSYPWCLRDDFLFSAVDCEDLFASFNTT